MFRNVFFSDVPFGLHTDASIHAERLRHWMFATNHHPHLALVRASGLWTVEESDCEVTDGVEEEHEGLSFEFDGVAILPQSDFKETAGVSIQRLRFGWRRGLVVQFIDVDTESDVERVIGFTDFDFAVVFEAVDDLIN